MLLEGKDYFGMSHTKIREEFHTKAHPAPNLAMGKGHKKEDRRIQKNSFPSSFVSFVVLRELCVKNSDEQYLVRCVVRYVR